MPQDWDIKARSAACDACGRSFDDGETYFSGLSFGDDGYIRRDCCADCWQSDNDRHQAFSAWQGTFRLPPAKPEEPVKKENAEDLLRRLIDEENSGDAPVIFILAVMLERKRILAEKEVRLEEDQSLRVYEHRKSGEIFVVQDPQLQLDRLEAVQAKVVQLLEGSASTTNVQSSQALPRVESAS